MEISISGVELLGCSVGFNSEFCLFACVFAIYKYIYNISIYKARRLKETNKAYVKDYLKDT